MKLGLFLPYIQHIPGVLQLWYGVSQWYRARGELKCEAKGLIYRFNNRWTCQWKPRWSSGMILRSGQSPDIEEVSCSSHDWGHSFCFFFFLFFLPFYFCLRGLQDKINRKKQEIWLISYVCHSYLDVFYHNLNRKVIKLDKATPHLRSGHPISNLKCVLALIHLDCYFWNTACTTIWIWPSLSRMPPAQKPSDALTCTPPASQPG